MVESLSKLKVTDEKDFNWVSHLRYYWMDEVINVSILDKTFEKDFSKRSFETKM